MHLKRLQLIGFKTFAERTVIDFTPGVTAIVGPNGSGKSNIADAILWVLGEQRVSAIRGSKLQDVIFSGSALRKPTGLAEVSLTVDNSDGSLPLAFSEVTVTRRAYRNGEGEFFINKSPCRLKDIQEMFLDTGVGRESYALVNQSEVDAVLSVDPQARRPLFEEAAGIHKFRVKKREALRKLEQTESHLVRIRDIVREIERQLGPLEVQAEAAIRYNAARERLEMLEKNFLIAEIREFDGSLRLIAADRASAVAIDEERTARLAVAEDRSAELSQSLSDADSELETVRSRHQEALSKLERVRGERELTAQRLNGIGAQAGMLADEVADIEERLAAAENRLATVGDSAGDAHGEIAAMRARIDVLEAQRRELLPRIARIRQSEETRRRRVAEHERSRIMLEADLAAVKARIAHAAEQEAELVSRVAAASGSSGQIQDEYGKRQIELGRAREAADAARVEAAAAEAQVQRDREALAAAQTELSTLQSAAASMRSRLQTLEELEAAHEGYYSGVRAVVHAAASGRLEGAYVVVADAFTVASGFDVAFEVALGGSVQDIIVDSEDQAKTAIEMLKRDRAGRATFLPLSRIRAGGSRPNVPAGLAGCRGVASEIAVFDPVYREVIEMLLGRVLVCDAIDDALAASRRATGWSKIVTLTGEVIFPSGAIAGGSSAKASSSLLHRKTEISSLVEQTATAGQKLNALHDSVTEIQARLQAALADQSQSGARVAELTNGLNTLERDVDQSNREMARIRRDESELSSRLIAVRGERANAEHLAEERQRALGEWDDSAQGSSAGGDAGNPDESAMLPVLIESEQSIQEELTRLKVDLASIQEKRTWESRVVESARAEIASLQIQRVRRTERAQALESESVALRTRTDELASAEQQATGVVSAVRGELESRQESRRAIADSCREAQTLVRSLTQERSQARADVQSAELKEAKLQMQYTQSAARLLEEYDLTAVYALSLAESPFVAPDTPREVGRLRRELRSFGDVNTSAAAEYAELRSRYDSMSEQQIDAETAKDRVLAAIREIDDSTRDLFMASFLQVGAAFEAIFQRLMGGGRTELTLTEPENLLETGIEIAVQVPGKKKQNLLLLSGGERALTAVALLFAFLKVRPAPFCVLDEVDAPLDGVNVERFAGLLRDFGLDGQFLVITHNPSTMEAARCWYGVTMQEPGVSRVLSMEAPGAEYRPQSSVVRNDPAAVAPVLV